MPDSPPLKASDFYDIYPSLNHRTGDIWRDLPSFGMLGRETTFGIVITPACDLANGKCETITYLPIISVANYLTSEAFRYDCWLEVAGSFLPKTKGFSLLEQPKRYGLPLPEDLETVVQMQSDADAKKLSDAESGRLDAYLMYVKLGHEGKPATVELIKRIMRPEKYQQHMVRIVTNAHKADIHFLPADEQPTEVSAIPSHSVILFRYPLSVPIALLSSAQNLSPTQWPSYTKKAEPQFPTLKHMKAWPIKLSSLRGEFLSDLLSRYVNTYIRLGSSDFEGDAVKAMCSQIGD